MAIITSEDDPFINNVPKFCLLCGKPLTFPLIYWAADHNFAAHPECLEGVVWGLLRDVWELQLGRQQANRRYEVLGNLCGMNVAPFK
jgi:hypothetical protein